MNQNAQYELYQIKKDLDNVISELNDVAFYLCCRTTAELCAARNAQLRSTLRSMSARIEER